MSPTFETIWALARQIPEMQKEIPELEKFIQTYPELPLGSLPIYYGDRELTGTLKNKMEVLDNILRDAFRAAARNSSFANPEGMQIMKPLTIGTLKFQLVAKGCRGWLDYDTKQSCVQYQFADLELPHLPVQLQKEADDAEKLLSGIRNLVANKARELERSRQELAAKIARLAKLQSTPPEEFDAAGERSALSLELEQIIYELNKTSEGMRKRYESEEEPLLSDYFPMLGKVKALGNIEILDGGEEDTAEEESA